MSQVVCAVHNNKGGVGKTTITVLLASAIAYEAGLRVLVLDVDTTQNTIFSTRQTELTDYTEALSSYEKGELGQIETYQLNRIKSNLEKGIGVNDLFTVERATPEMVSRAAFNKLAYDVIFVDMGAKMESQYGSLLNKFDLLLIPFGSKNYELESSLEYAAFLAEQMRKGELPDRLRVRAFWNKVKVFSGPKCDEAERFLAPYLEGVNVSFFNTRLYDAETGFGPKKLNTTYSSPFAALEEKDLSVLKNAGTTQARTQEREYLVRVKEFINESVEVIQEILDEKANG